MKWAAVAVLRKGKTTTTWFRACITNIMFNDSVVFLPFSFHALSKVNVHMSLISPPTHSPSRHSDVVRYDLRSQAKILFFKLQHHNNLDNQNIISKSKIQPNTIVSGPEVWRNFSKLLSLGSIIFVGGSSKGTSMAQQSPNASFAI